MIPTQTTTIHPLELTVECQTTIDERMVAQGIAIAYYPCPICGAHFDRESRLLGIDHPDYGQVAIFACCFMFCHGEIVENEGACDNCGDCSDHCDCYHCDCGNVVEDVCSNCHNCDDCCDCITCAWCDEPSSETTTVGYSEYCQYCLDDNFTYCDDCDEYFSNDDDHSHFEPDCDCEPPVPHFQFPANGHGTVAENERLTVELPKGTIDDEGLRCIARIVQEEIYRASPGKYHTASEIINEIGPLWQAKRGNFTRRLSSALYQHGVKLDSGVISQIGNVARQHSSNTATWHVEVTRDLNEPAEHFYHEDSCWWDSYSGSRPSTALTSRCCLKSWGGIGIRSFASDHGRSYDYPTGRAWIQPLDVDMEPTHDAINAHAYVIYNGYGDIDGYVAARIVAHLTSRSYKKIKFSASDVYVNAGGYLIADEATCAATDTVNIHQPVHDTGDADAVRQALGEAA